MAPVTRRRASVGSETATTETSVVPVKRPARRAKVKRDSTRDASRNFFQKARGSKKYRGDADGAKSQIQEAFRDFSKTIRQERRTPPPEVNMAESLRHHLPDEFRNILYDDANPTADQASRLLRQMRTTAQGYAAIALQDSTVRRPRWMLWEQDGRDLDRLNRRATATAATLVNGLVLPDAPGAVAAQSTPPADAVDRVAWDLFGAVRPREGDKTWGRMAQDQIAALTGLLGVE